MRTFGWTPCVLATALLTAGCCSFHSVTPVPPDRACVCTGVCQQSRSRVHIFFVQGCDLLDCANLEGVKAYLLELGFHRCWFGHKHHLDRFRKEVVCIHRADPHARFVLIGFGSGAPGLCELAHLVRDDGIQIDLLVSLDGQLEKVGPQARPTNVCRFLQIVPGCDGPHEECAGVVTIGKASHKEVPTHPDTLRILVHELSAIAGAIPGVEDLPRVPRLEDPTPLPIAARANEAADSWDFLKPASVDQSAKPDNEKPPLRVVKLPPER